jgi:eukaryotic-like serine/threonine-protein kinase
VVPVEQPPTPAPQPAKPEPQSAASAAAAAANAGVESCRDKSFVTREFCLAEQCAKAGTRNNPLCVQYREQVRLREESKVRN